MIARAATPADSGAIARIYDTNRQPGIEDRAGTFETRVRTAKDIEKWFDEKHPLIVVERAGEVIAFASTSSYRPRECYAGIAEVSAYVAREWRGRGAGRVAMNALFGAARAAGFHKLVSRIFPENGPSLQMIAALGFRRWAYTGATASWMECGGTW